MVKNQSLFLSTLAVLSILASFVVLNWSGSGHEVQAKSILGRLSFKEMRLLNGKAEGPGCSEYDVDCWGNKGSYNSNCTGCAAFLEEVKSSSDIILGVQTVYTRPTCGEDTKWEDWSAGNKKCTAKSTCTYSLGPDGKGCVYAQGTCSGPGCPGEFCYLVSGTPPTDWLYEPTGSCVDP